MSQQDDESRRAKKALLLRMFESEMSEPAYQDQTRLFAKRAFDRFNAFVAAGFTVEQALFLVREE